MIDAAERAALLARSPYNAVAIDLPKPFDPADPASEPSGDPYEDAARTIDAWRADGALVADERAVDLGDDPGLHRAPTAPATPATASSPGSGSRTTTTGSVRPHERTHPGPLQDRLELTRATGYNLSPIFSLSTADAWPLVEPALGGRALGRGDRRDRHRQPRLAGRPTRRSTPPSPSASPTPSC